MSELRAAWAAELARVIAAPPRARRVLIVHDSPLPARIGDHVRITDAWGGLRERFGGAEIDLWVDHPISLAIHEGSPEFRAVRLANLRSADELPYDLVLALAFDEEALAAQLEARAFRGAVGGLGHKYFARRRFFSPALSPAAALVEGLPGAWGGRLRLTELERREAEETLARAGLGPDEPLLILIDAASDPVKTMAPSELAFATRWALDALGARGLVYVLGDEDPRPRYAALGLEDRLIFHRSRGLRSDIALLGARSVRLILGPDTGMLHAASAVWADAERPPRIVCYVGRFAEADPWFWWGRSRARCGVVMHDGSLRPLSALDPRVTAVPERMGLARELAGRELVRFLGEEGLVG